MEENRENLRNFEKKKSKTFGPLAKFIKINTFFKFVKISRVIMNNKY